MLRFFDNGNFKNGSGLEGQDIVPLASGFVKFEMFDKSKALEKQ